MSNQENKSTFFGGVAILAVGIVIVKLIGAFYKIPVGNILGTDGFAHFNNAYDIFNVLLMVSTAGLPVALSKTISEANAQGRQNQVRRVFHVALVTFLILGTISFLILYTFAGSLSDVQGDKLAVYAVQALSPCCLFVCLMAAFRGYAQGHGNMVPTSVSQIIEALGKLVIGLFLAYYIMKLGMGKEYGAAGAIAGVSLGGLFALIFLVITHVKRRRGETLTSRDVPDSPGQILKSLLKIAIPITIGASVVPITTWLDTTQVQNILQNTLGYTLKESNDLFGSYKMAVTIYTLPSSFMVAITASVIPAISAYRARHDKAGAGRIAESSLRVAALVALPAGVGLSVLSTPIIKFLYPVADAAVAGPALMVMGVAVIFVCIMSVSNSILQANGMVNLPIVIMALGSVVKLAVNAALVSNPNIGINGAAYGTLSCYVIISVLELLLIKRAMPASPNYARVFVKPLIAALLMGAAAWAAYGLLSRFLGNSISTLAAILVGGVVYLILVVVLRIIGKDDLALMPKGDKIAKFLRL
ncbi:MAG: polysaccharide biosynthesis protein [Clostridia bacterium]|nr:polysaccharide biosynthesis protein [Clostridia bacterium]